MEEVVVTLPTETVTVSENKLYGTPVSEAGGYKIYDIEAEWNEEKLADVKEGDSFTPDMVTLRPVLYWYDGDGNLDKDNIRHPVTYGSPLTAEEYTFSPATFTYNDYIEVYCTYVGSAGREELADVNCFDGTDFWFEYWLYRPITEKTYTGLDAFYTGEAVLYVGDILNPDDFTVYAFYDTVCDDGSSIGEYSEHITEGFTISPSVIAEGTNTLTVSYTEGGKTYKATAEETVTGMTRTVAGDLKDAKIGTIKKQLCTGYPVCPSPKVTYKKKALLENVDYVLSYENNVEEGTATVTVTGIGNYEGSISKTFSIYKNDIKKATVKSIPKQLYTGSEIIPELTVKYSGKALVEGKDYEVSFASNIEEGKAVVTLTGLGSYKGSKTAKFTIYKVKIGSCKISGVSTMAYTGKESSVILPLTITYKGNTLAEGTDYSLTYANNNGPGKASVTITGLGSYKGSVTKNFTIKDFSTENWKMKLSASSFLYTGEAVEPAVTVTCKSGTLTYGTHYTVKYENNVNEGTAKASVLDMDGNVVLEKTFTIYKADLGKATIKGLTKQQYTGESITPQFTVVYKKQTLTEGLHYTVTYSNNKDVGKAAVTINAGRGGTGSKSKTFTICRVKMANVKADSIYDYPYTGKAVIPSLRLTYQGVSLVEGKDYTVTFEKNVELGKAKAIITGINGFTGTKKLKFTITKTTMADLTITGVDSSYKRIGATTVNEYKELAQGKYEGFAIEPEVTVKSGATVLRKGTDYTVSYSNNRGAGTASVTIKGKSSFSGSRTLYFTITGGKTPLESLIEDTYGKTVNWKSESSVAALMDFLKNYGITSMDHVYDGENSPAISIEIATVVLLSETVDYKTPLNWGMQKERLLDPESYFDIKNVSFSLKNGNAEMDALIDYKWEFNFDFEKDDFFTVTITRYGSYTGTMEVNLFDCGLERTDSSKGQAGYEYLTYCKQLEEAYGGSIVSEENGTDWYNPPRWFFAHNLHLTDWYNNKVDGTPAKKADGSHNLPQYTGVAEEFTLKLLDTTYDKRTPLNWKMQKHRVNDPIDYYNWDEIDFELYHGNTLLVEGVDYTFEYVLGSYLGDTDYWGIKVTGIGNYGGTFGFSYYDYGLTFTNSTENAPGHDFLAECNTLGFVYMQKVTDWNNPPQWFFDVGLDQDEWCKEMREATEKPWIY